MLAQETAKRVLAEALKTGADLAEIYVEDVESLELGLDDSRLEKAVRGADRGAGVRVFFGNLVTYAYTDDLAEPSLLDAARAAAAAGRVAPGPIDLTERKSALNLVRQHPANGTLKGKRYRAALNEDFLLEVMQSSFNLMR